MSCEVEYAEECEAWWGSLREDEQVSIAAIVGVLEEKGTGLTYPYRSGVESSRHSHMRELRIQHRGKPYRIPYALDPRRTAMLLIGGCKVGDDRWYEENVPKADKPYDDHLKSIG
jgi:hypothetical protein